MVKLGLGSFIPFNWGFLGRSGKRERYSAPEHLRIAFEELGPTFIKLAQILSTRPDIISPEYAEEFSRLLDRVPALPFDEIRPVLEEELSAPHNKLFRAFDTKPLASASIGQVYRAELQNGQRVVVKIQKPGVQEQISEDLEILKEMIGVISRRTEFGRTYDLEGFLAEFSFSLNNELNYVREGQNADRFGKMFSEDSHVFIPRVYWDFTTKKILVMEEVRGNKVNELGEATDPESMDRNRLAHTAVETTFREIFEYGFFHADPHAGNFVIMGPDTLGLMDFGLVGYLDEKDKEFFLRFVYEMVNGNTEEMMDAMWDLGMTGKFAARPALKRDLNHFLYRFRGSSLGDIAAGDMLRDLMSIAYRHQVHFPSNLALLLKVLTMSEGLGAMLDPHFSFFEFAGPYLKKMYVRSFSPENLARKLEENTQHLLQLANGLPKRTSHLLQRLETGDLHFTMQHLGLEKNAERIYSAINRLTVSILLTLFLIAFGIYILAGHFMGFHHTLVHLLLVSFIISGVVTIRIFYNMWRQRR